MGIIQAICNKEKYQQWRVNIIMIVKNKWEWVVSVLGKICVRNNYRSHFIMTGQMEKSVWCEYDSAGLTGQALWVWLSDVRGYITFKTK